MALINVGQNYTRTGNGALTSWGNRISLLPFINQIPFLGSAIGATLGYIDTAIEAAGWLIKGKPLSAATVAATGFVSNSVNGLTNSPFFWPVNAASAALTGRTIGTHARALTEGGLGMVTGALGVRPTVLRSYPAGIGSIGGQAQQGPGQFAAAESSRRGQDANAQWNNYRNGAGADHVAALESGRAQAAGQAQR